MIDNFLNKITMYRLVLYSCIVLLLAALGLSFFGLLPFAPLALIFSTLFFVAVCYVANTVCAWAFDVGVNTESLYITALILALIVNPISSPTDWDFWNLAIWGSVWAMATKYLFAIKRKHVFNPVAIAVVITAFTLGLSASWWVGTLVMLPFVLITGLLITRKIHRFDLVLSFLGSALVSILGFGLIRGAAPLPLLTSALTHAPIFFFAFFMLTEPLTTPPTRELRIQYGMIVGLLFSPAIHLFSVYSTPELALLVGNIASYIASPKYRLMLKMKEKVLVGDDTYDYIFENRDALAFSPGQYFEWTLPHADSDDRGNRRYFTIASSPTEPDVHLGVKFYPEPSTFKKTLLAMQPGDAIAASQLSGDFTMPTKSGAKLAFIAGGIGVTPFRSMIKYLVDTNQKADVTIFYCAKHVTDLAYKDLFDEAAKRVGIKPVYVLSDVPALPKDWTGKSGFLDAKMLAAEVPDFKDHIFYLSGPHGMVTTFERTLASMGVPASHVKTDYFPGFA
jgi:ferredoxin-NADP reductase/Na+-translocating ferredoxin:NAD+ oxidoreductase RnfD subunit